MKAVINLSKIRTIYHNDNGKVIEIGPGQLATLPNDVADAIMHAWPDVQFQGDDSPKVEPEPWEAKLGPVWDAAVKEHHIKLDKAPKATDGPDRPPVVEPPTPKDDTGEKNTHLCTYCQAEFPKLTELRKHQKKEHNV